MPELAVAAEEFGYRYPGAPADALAGVTLDIAEGEFVVLCGESGSGKSTLLRAACGLVPHFHGGDARGELNVCGLSVREHAAGDLAAVCGTLFQDPETQVVMGGVRAEIALPLEHRGDDPGAVARGVEEAALALGIGHLLDRRTETLSGGELQRVALAAALAPRPSVLLLDEPTSQLDPVAGDELVGLLRRLNEEWGTTVIVGEHRLDRLLPVADRVIALRAGRVVRDSDPAGFVGWAARDAEGLVPPLARMFSLAGLSPLPRSVKEARTLLPAVSAALPPSAEETPRRGQRLFGRRTRGGGEAALRMRGAWFEIEDGPAILRGLDVEVRPGELVGLMGRNGAGKSTLLRLARGLAEPTRGRVERAGDVALLLQNPNDYLVHERICDEVGEDGAARAGLAGRGESHPRDLSGGERQRLALEVAIGERPWAAVCLDEPTRGMDRPRRLALAERLREIAAGGAAVLVATHDTDFVASWAERVILLGEGRVIASGPPASVLSGGWHFATDVARALRGSGGALTPEAGAALVAAAREPDPRRVPA